jgi:flagellar hook-associated protein 3 FlgL
MRITHFGSYHAALQRVTGSSAATATARDPVTSGRRLSRPADDPTGMSRALELRAALRVAQQERRNADDGVMWVNLADTRLQNAVEKLQRAREVAGRGATFSNGDEHTGIAAEIAAIRDGIVEIANAQHQGRRLFAGLSSRDAVVTTCSGWTYQGDDGVVNRRISDTELVRVNVTADEVFGFTSGRDVFSVLDDFETALLAGDTAGINGAIGEIDGAMNTILTSLAHLGAAGDRIKSAQNTILERTETIHRQLSALEDADLTDAIMELQLDQTQYEAALAAFANASRASLVDFLR